MVRFTRDKRFVGCRIPVYIKSYQTNKTYGPLYGDSSIEIDENGGIFELYAQSAIIKHIFGNINITAPINSDSAFTVTTTGGGNYGEVVAHLIWSKQREIPDKIKTKVIQNCDKIILKPKSLEVEVKIEKDNFDDFDFIKINGHKFKKV